MIIETFTLVNITNGFRLPRKSKSCYQQHDRRQSRGSSPGHMISHQHQDDTLYWNTGILGHFQLTSSQLSFSFLGRSLSILTPPYSITLLSCFPQSYSMVLVISHLFYQGLWFSKLWLSVCTHYFIHTFPSPHTHKHRMTSNVADVCVLTISHIMNILGKFFLNSFRSLSDKPSYRKRK